MQVPIGRGDIIRIAHFVPGIGPSAFGVGSAALHLASAQDGLGCRVRIWCQDNADQTRWASEASGFPENGIVRFPVFGPRRLGYSPRMERAATRPEGHAFDIVHQHGIWMALSRVTVKWRNATGRPTVVAPHGSLEPWCLSVSRWKKRLVLGAYEGENLPRAACLLANSVQEMRSIREFGLTQPVAVVHNGIPVSRRREDGDENRFRNKWGIPPSERILLFLSRIHPKKGLPLLLRAIQRVRHRMQGWVLVIAGPDEAGHESELRRLTTELNLDRTVRFLGPLFGEGKWDAFIAADVFVLPTHSENFGIVVLESLDAGLPVLTTKGAPWEELLTHQCGWWVDVSVEALADALLDATSRPPEELKRMGLRGHDLVASKYSWPRAARLTVELYEWLLGRGGVPDFVALE